MGRRRGLDRPRRLRCVDYSSYGEYFITTVVRDRAHLFGDVADGVVRLSPAGEVVRRAWNSLPRWFPMVRLDESVVMPNHFHGVLLVLASGGPHLDAVIQRFKSASAIEVNRLLGQTGRPVWQPGFFEHVIRSDRSLEAIRAYIRGNPATWPSDPYNR